MFLNREFFWNKVETGTFERFISQISFSIFDSVKFKFEQFLTKILYKLAPTLELIIFFSQIKFPKQYSQSPPIVYFGRKQKVFCFLSTHS